MVGYIDVSGRGLAERSDWMNQKRQIVPNTAFLTVFSFFCASFIWVLVLFAASSVARIPDNFGVALLWGPPVLVWTGLTVTGLINRRRSAQAAGIVLAAMIPLFLCGGSWGLLLTLILTHD
jgi:hypothetical protein